MSGLTSAQISQLIGQQQAMAYNQMQYAQALSHMNMGMSGTVGTSGAPSGAAGFAAASTMMQGMQYAPQIGTTLGLAGGVAAGAMGIGGMSLGGAGSIAAGAGIGGLLGGPGGAVAGAAWGALPAGLAAPLMAIPAAAGYAASQMGQGFGEYGATRQALGGFNFVNPGARSGRGFSAGQAGQITSMLRDVASSTTGAGMQELTQMVAQIPDTGLMQGVRDAQEFSRKFKEIVGGVKQMAEVLGTSLQEALPFFADMRRSGFYTAQDVLGNAVQRQVMGSMGYTGPQFTALQRGGAAVAQAHGGRRVTGARLATRLAGSIGGAVQGGILPEEMVLEATGGVGGPEGYSMLAGRFTEQAFNFTHTPVGRAMMLAVGEKEGGRYTGGVDQGQLARLRAGEIDVTNLRSEGSRRLGGGGKSRISFVANEELIRGNMAEQMGPEIIESVVRDVAGGRGIAGAEDDIVTLLMKRFTNLGRGEAEVMVEIAQNAKQIRREQRERTMQEIDREINQAQTRAKHSWAAKKDRMRTEWALTVGDPLKGAGQELGREMEEGVNRLADKVYGRTTMQFTDTDRMRLAYGGFGAFQGGGPQPTTGDLSSQWSAGATWAAGVPGAAVRALLPEVTRGGGRIGTREFRAGVRGGGNLQEMQELELRRAEGRFTSEMMGGLTEGEALGRGRAGLVGGSDMRRERMYRRMEAGHMDPRRLAKVSGISSDAARAAMGQMGFDPDEEYAVGAIGIALGRSREEAEGDLRKLAGGRGVFGGTGGRRGIVGLGVNVRGVRRERVMTDMLESSSSGVLMSYLGSSGGKDAKVDELREYAALLTKKDLSDEEEEKLARYRSSIGEMTRKQADTMADIVEDSDEAELRDLAGSFAVRGDMEKQEALQQAAKKMGRGISAKATTESMERAGVDKAVQAEIRGYASALKRGEAGSTEALSEAIFSLSRDQRGAALGYLGELDPGLAEIVAFRGGKRGMKQLAGKQYEGAGSRGRLVKDISQVAGQDIGEFMSKYESMTAEQREKQFGAEGATFYADLVKAIEDSKLSPEEAEEIGDALARSMEGSLAGGGITGGTKTGAVTAEVAGLAVSVEQAAKANTIFVQTVADNVKGLKFDKDAMNVLGLGPAAGEEP